MLIEQDHALGDREAGLGDFQAFNERFPDSPWLHLLLGDAYSAKNDDPQAEDEYRLALKLRPDLPIAHYQLGFIAFKHGNYADAEQQFRGRSPLIPPSLKLTSTWGQLYAGWASPRILPLFAAGCCT